MIEERSLMDKSQENDSAVEEQNNGDSYQLGENSTTFEKAEDLDDSMWDFENNTFKSEEIYKAYKSEKDKASNLRKTLSKGSPRAAKKIEDFTIDNAEELGIDSSNDKLEVLKNIALETGLSNQQFQKMITAFHKACKDGSLELEDEIDPEEYAQKEQERIESEIKILGKDGIKVVNNVKAWGKKLMNEGVLSKEDFESYIQLGTTAQQIRVLDKLRQVSGYIDDIAVNVGSINGDKSREEIEDMMSDPRYETSAAYRASIDKWFAENYKNTYK